MMEKRCSSYGLLCTNPWCSLNMLYPLIKERSQPLKLLFFHNLKSSGKSHSHYLELPTWLHSSKIIFVPWLAFQKHNDWYGWLYILWLRAFNCALTSENYSLILLTAIKQNIKNIDLTQQIAPLCMLLAAVNAYYRLI